LNRLPYHASVYDRDRPVGSYWETTDLITDSTTDLTTHLITDQGIATAYPPLQGNHTCEVAIIGGGLTGLSAAWHLASEHGIEASVLEAGIPGWGASGRNGGFCCVGGTALSHQQLMRQFGLAETQRYYQEQREAIDWVQQLAALENIAIDRQGNGEIVVAHLPGRQKELQTKRDFLSQIAGYPCQLWSREELAEQAFSSPEAYAALWIGVGFGLNPMKYCRGLAQAALKRGAKIYSRSPVMAWERAGNQHLLHTPTGTLKAKTVILATNGYTPDRLHPSLKGCLLPALSQIITTRPLTAAERAAQGWRTETPVYDTRNLLFYYRLLKDGRFLFGSRGGAWGSPQESDRHQAWMTRRLGELFPAWREVEISHSWSGLVCLSAPLTPYIGELPCASNISDSNVFAALAYHGNGVATGTWSGQWVARLAAGKAKQEQLCAVFRQPLKPFPLPHLRKGYLRLAYFLYRIADQMGNNHSS
jgi:glycine/D-amino acid oxidase-like deaminating enzyme